MFGPNMRRLLTHQWSKLQSRVKSMSPQRETAAMWRDWQVRPNADSAEGTKISGWVVSTPQRYFMVSCTTILIGLLFESWLIISIGASLSLWASRRFSVVISSTSGVCVTSSFILPYKHARLPLRDTSFIVQRSLNRVEPLTSPPNLSKVVEVSVSHNKITQPIVLQRQSYQAAERLARVGNHMIKRALAMHQVTAEPIHLYYDEPGEWTIALMELLPQLLLPTKQISLTQTKLTWWSPKVSTYLGAGIGVLSGFGVMLFAPALGLCSLILALLILFNTKELLLISHGASAVMWRRSLFGITIDEGSLFGPLWVELQRDLRAPNGRSVILADLHMNHLQLGQPWDAQWLYQEIERSLIRHQLKRELRRG